MPDIFMHFVFGRWFTHRSEVSKPAPPPQPEPKPKDPPSRG
jgi:hypothetical protein